MQGPLNTYKSAKNEQIINYTSHEQIFGKEHPAFNVQLTAKNGKHDVEQLRNGTIINDNVNYMDFTAFPDDFQNNMTLFNPWRKW